MRGAARGIAVNCLAGGFRLTGHHPLEPGSPLNGSDNLGRDPAAIEAARLRLHTDAVDVALDSRRVEGEMTAKGLEPWLRVLVGPSDRLEHDRGGWTLQ